MTEKGVFIVNGTERVVVSQLYAPQGLLRPDAGQDLRPRHLLRQDDPGPRVARVRHRQEGHRRRPSGPQAPPVRQYACRAFGIAETDEEILALFDGAESIRNTWSGTLSPTRTRRCSTSTASSGPASRQRSSRHGTSCRLCSATRSGTTRHGWPLQARSEVWPARGLRAPLRRAWAPQRRRHPRHHPLPDPSPRRDPDLQAHQRDRGTGANRRHRPLRQPPVRTVGELIQNQVRVGLTRLERVVRERMTTQDPESITPQSLINIRP